MLISNPFTNQQQNQQNNQQQNNQNNNNQQTTQPDNNQQNNSSGVIPDNSQQNTNQQNNNQQNNQQSQSKGDPLEDFATLWDTPAVDPNKPVPTEPDGYLPKIDPTKLNEMVGKLDFTKNVTPEQRALISAGGEPAVQAMMDVMNSATRNAFLMAFQGTQRMVETGIGTAKERFMGEVPNFVKDQMSLDGLSTSNPIMKDPAYAKLVTDVRQQIQSKHPKATPTQIESAVNKYFDKMAETLNKAKSQNDSQQTQNDNTQKVKTGAADANWEEWFAGEAIAKQ